MSVNNYQFICPQCGHVENQSEGIYLFSDKCFVLLQCPHCKKIESISLTSVETQSKQYPKCHDCHIVLVTWTKTCPICESTMKIASSYSDVI